MQVVPSQRNLPVSQQQHHDAHDHNKRQPDTFDQTPQQRSLSLVHDRDDTCVDRSNTDVLARDFAFHCGLHTGQGSSSIVGDFVLVVAAIDETVGVSFNEVNVKQFIVLDHHHTVVFGDQSLFPFVRLQILSEGGLFFLVERLVVWIVAIRIEPKIVALASIAFRATNDASIFQQVLQRVGKNVSLIDQL